MWGGAKRRPQGREQVPHAIRPGDVVAARYRMVDLLEEIDEGGWFWRAYDEVLARHVAFHVIGADDERAPLLLDAAKRSATVADARLLRVLDADERDDLCYVVNEWGKGTSLDLLVAEEPLPPRRAAWVAAEVADALAHAHAGGQTHGRLLPENVLVDHNGQVKIIGFAVDAALHGLPAGRPEEDLVDLAGILYAGLVGRWPGRPGSRVPPAPTAGGHPLRPRQVRAGVPRALDLACERVLGSQNHDPGEHSGPLHSVGSLHRVLTEFVGDADVHGAGEPDETMLWPMAAELTEPVGTEPVGTEPVDTEREPQPRSDGTGEQSGRTATMPQLGQDPDPDPAAQSPESGLDTAAGAAAGAATDTDRDTDRDTDTDTDTDMDTDTAAEGVGSGHDPQAPRDLGATVVAVPDPGLHDDWRVPRPDRPPPPPAFEDLPAKPLYAPDPVRRPRDGGRAQSKGPARGPARGQSRGQGQSRGRGRGESRDETAAEPWSTEATMIGPPEADDPAARAARRRERTAMVEAYGPYARPEPAPEPPRRRVTGRTLMRVLALLLVAALVAAAAVFAFTLGRSDQTSDTSDSTDTAEGDGAAAGEVVEVASVADFDPQGDGSEQPGDTGAVVDGDPGTGWSTDTYEQEFGPRGLKEGVGLVLDLGDVQPVGQLEIDFAGSPTSIAAYLTDDAPRAEPAGEPAADGTAEADRLSLELADNSSGRYLLVWLTSLPGGGGEFRGEIREIRLRS